MCIILRWSAFGRGKFVWVHENVHVVVNVGSVIIFACCFGLNTQRGFFVCCFQMVLTLVADNRIHIQNAPVAPEIEIFNNLRPQR